MIDATSQIKTLDSLLCKSFDLIPKEGKIGILFSGGIDSSQIAWYAKKFKLSPTLFTFGSKYSKDYEFASRLANDLVLPFHYLNLDEKIIAESINPVKELLTTVNIENNLMQISLAIGFYQIAKMASTLQINLFLSGQGSDELFGGYNKYLKLLNSPEQLQKQMKLDTENLFRVDMIRDKTMTNHFGIDIAFPYLYKPLISYVQSIPIEFKINEESRKWLIRELGKKNGLPDYIFTRPKNALQYSSGIQKIAEKILKNDKT